MTDEIDYTTVTFPPLPTPEEVKYSNFQGPIPESNKVIEGIYAGAFPGNVIDAKNTETLIHILNCGINKFVCLQKEYVPDRPRMLWYKTGIRPYFQDVQFILKNKNKYEKLQTSVEEATFEHLPIKDLHITDDHNMIIMAKKLVKDYYHGASMYIHCWGGHGRTGVLICIMLHLMYGLSPDDALSYCEAVHNKRIAIPYVHGTEELVTSPQTNEQFIQVRRIITKLRFNKIFVTIANEHENI